MKLALLIKKIQENFYHIIYCLTLFSCGIMGKVLQSVESDYGRFIFFKISTGRISISLSLLDNFSGMFCQEYFGRACPLQPKFLCDAL